ncbi:hypothetical protein [Azospirillum sp. B506]|uniref:hypothetical protein n=1 Tax=Azospirillum sp. B506 TaxID=137721 RepID=UPI001FCBDB78|nr:hypothetical protein [Azospirillum sp. B506]
MRVLSVCAAVVCSLSIASGIVTAADAAEPRLMAALGNTVLTMTDIGAKQPRWR